MSYYADLYRIDPEAKRKHFWKYFSDVDGPVLDIGCTTGNFLQWRPDGTIGVDLDLIALGLAAGRGLRVVRADADHRLCFADRAFAGVNLSAVLEHVERPLALLRDVRRVLVPGGKAVVLVPDVTRYRFGYWHDYTHRTPFTRRGLERIAVDAGFRDFEIRRYAFHYLKYLPGAHGPRVRVWLDVVERLIAQLHSKDLILVARKT